MGERKRGKFDGNFTVKAVEAGNIDVLKWVISENCAMPFMAIYRAVKQNRKDMFLPCVTPAACSTAPA